MDLTGKVALVTGAGRGLGRAEALALAAAGAKVLVNDLGGTATGSSGDPGPAREVAEEITAAGGIAIADQSDISSWSAAAGLVDRAVAEFGRLDIVVSNAGICRPTAFGSLSEDEWTRLMDVNAKGTAAVIEAATRHWRTAGPEAGRAIVCTASPAGAHPNPPLGIYGVTKAAVLAIAQVAAQELALLGVRVNSLAPVARTRMLSAAMSDVPGITERIMPRDPDYDLYDPDHVARLVLYMVSPRCGFTGRLFGVRADDVFLYEGWNAAHHVTNGGTAWEVGALADALDAIAPQEQASIIGPLGRTNVPSPGSAVIEALVAVR